jgi:hypothetical protein
MFLTSKYCRFLIPFHYKNSFPSGTPLSFPAMPDITAIERGAL